MKTGRQNKKLKRISFEKEVVKIVAEIVARVEDVTYATPVVSGRIRPEAECAFQVLK